MSKKIGNHRVPETRNPYPVTILNMMKINEML